MFLTARKQKVVLNGEDSFWADVLSGVPQGSVIGLLLFVIYINHLPEEVHTTVLYKPPTGGSTHDS